MMYLNGRSRNGWALLACAAAACSAVASAQTCPAWESGALGVPGLDRGLRGMTVYDLGAGPALYVGGGFNTAGGNPALRIAKWDGTQWSGFGSGPDRTVNGLGGSAVSGTPLLYVTGSFTAVGGLPALGIAAWDGLNWAAVGEGLDSRGGRGFLEYDDGGGLALYAFGFFFSASGIPGTGGIARWNGAAWSSVGGGTNATVNTLCAFDDGTGVALYAGGTFTQAGAGLGTNLIARWDGVNWTDVGNGMSGGLERVNALTVYDHGAGPVLYAAGNFATAGRAAVSNVAFWNGSAWSDVGGGTDNTVSALQVFDDGDGNGSSLFAGGSFDFAAGVFVSMVAKWNGSVWSKLAEGLAGGAVTTGSALAVLDDGSGPALYVGGGFETAGALPAANIARWAACSNCPGDLDGDGDTDLADLGILLADFGCGPPGLCIGDLNGDGFTDLADLGILLADFGCAP